MNHLEQVKEAGFKGMSQVSRIIGVSPDELKQWHKTRPELFRIILLGCRSDLLVEARIKESKKDCKEVSNSKTNLKELAAIGIKDEKLMKEIGVIQKFKLMEQCRIMGIEGADEIAMISSCSKRSVFRMQKESPIIMLAVMISVAKLKYGDVISPGYLDFLKSKEFEAAKGVSRPAVYQAAGFSTMKRLARVANYCPERMFDLWELNPDYFNHLVAGASRRVMSYKFISGAV